MRIGYTSAPAAAEVTEPGIDVITEHGVVSNIADCSADPGTLTPGQARRAHDIHRLCSPECLVRRRAGLTLAIAAPPDRSAFGISPGRSARYGD
ncbi:MULTISPECIES: hypothetical protein [Nocardia]|uniref:hypothetical protein n=1 Tax=Nocardia TaxID=1817 RepID=UPI001893C679|nr:MULTISPECIES: hypothetical protein [Nocardia]MBF6348507.1 hypothetical protein [Nocardia flavorosea]